MTVEKIFLRDKFELFKDEGKEATVTCYIQDNLTEMGRDDDIRPCVVVCPGGGYACCSQREAEPIALELLPLGFNVFVLNYTCAPARFPLAIRQVAATFELIKDNAKNWHCDIEKVAVMGFSAGGHLAAHYSTAYDCNEVREVFKNSIRPFASILCYPVISDDGSFAHRGSFENLLGYFPEGEEKYSCDKLVSEKTPQAFIWHTAEDSCVPVQNSIVYANALASYKIPFELHIYPFGEHGLSTLTKQTCGELENKILTNEWLHALRKWTENIF